MNNIIEIRVPDLGDFTSVPVVEISVAPGDVVEKGDSLIALESDKATLDVPATMAGQIVELKVAENDLVGEGSLILLLSSDENSISDDSAPPHATKSDQEQTAELAIPITSPATPLDQPESIDPSISPVPVKAVSSHIYASPSVRRLARELGVDVTQVKGTGPKQRLTPEDIKAFVKASMTSRHSANPSSSTLFNGIPEWPNIDYAKFGPVERVPLTRIGRISGQALARNAMLIPHVTHFEKSDVTELEAFRQTMNAEGNSEDARITMLTFAVKAVVSSLKKYPTFNASLDGDELVLKSYWNIGVAANTPEGLVVPVVKGADQKGIREIAGEITALAAAARSGQLKPADMQGATFTISSLGGIGGTNFTPIINAPEVAILGMPRSDVQPVWDGSAFQPRQIQPISLSFDHRVVDGVAAAHFLAHVAGVLNDFRRVSE